MNEPEHLHADLQDQTQVREHEEVKTQHQTFHRRRWQTLQPKLQIRNDVSDDDTRDQKEDHHQETTAEEEMMDQETEEATRNHSSTTISSTESSATNSTQKIQTSLTTEEDPTMEMETEAAVMNHLMEEEMTQAAAQKHPSLTTSRTPAPPPLR